MLKNPLFYPLIKPAIVTRSFITFPWYCFSTTTVIMPLSVASFVNIHLLSLLPLPHTGTRFYHQQDIPTVTSTSNLANHSQFLLLELGASLPSFPGRWRHNLTQRRFELIGPFMSGIPSTTIIDHPNYCCLDYLPCILPMIRYYFIGHYLAPTFFSYLDQYALFEYIIWFTSTRQYQFPSATPPYLIHSTNNILSLFSMTLHYLLRLSYITTLFENPIKLVKRSSLVSIHNYPLLYIQQSISCIQHSTLHNTTSYIPTQS